jgi:uncharacterized protein YjdB
MKKKSKVILVFLCTLLLGTSLIFNRSSNNKVYADDGSVAGTTNLNNTSDNSAKVGDSLTAPEKGWQRFDDSNSKIKYLGSWKAVTGDSEGFYNSTTHYTSTLNDSISFKFYGTKLRIIQTINNNRDTNVSVTIDGVNKSTYSLYNASSQYQVLKFEQQNLSLGIHSVTITKATDNTMYLDLDAIDIDSTGYLIDPSATLATGISLDKTSLDMKTGDTSNLTATVTPDNATNKTVKWTSSDPSIATVDDNGKVTAVKEGSATITATTQDGSNQSATCTVNVKNPADGNALLTVTMTDGQQRSYDITMSQVNDFITWYNNRAGGQGGFTYSFNKTPSSAAYTKRTEYLIYDKISNYDVDEYKAN